MKANEQMVGHSGAETIQHRCIPGKSHVKTRKKEGSRRFMKIHWFLNMKKKTVEHCPIFIFHLNLTSILLFANLIKVSEKNNPS